ncbi:hypothetical protein ABIB80_000269 [Bradyrhizobium sp. i1.15.2]|uniref:hypothetical protein n=1 Tax=Bradyrhizobium sp. i1.15.2 TaxID=3156362 RepID=UPI00339785B3
MHAALERAITNARALGNFAARLDIAVLDASFAMRGMGRSNILTNVEFDVAANLNRLA